MASSCSICFEAADVPDTTCTLVACGHVFHDTCLAAWTVRNATCPVCRGSVICNHNNNGDASDLERLCSHRKEVLATQVQELSKMRASEKREAELRADEMMAMRMQRDDRGLPHELQLMHMLHNMLEPPSIVMLRDEMHLPGTPPPLARMGGGARQRHGD